MDRVCRDSNDVIKLLLHDAQVHKPENWKQLKEARNEKLQ